MVQGMTLANISGFLNNLNTFFKALWKKKLRFSGEILQNFYICVLISKASVLCYLRITLRHTAALRGIVSV